MPDTTDEPRFYVPAEEAWLIVHTFAGLIELLASPKRVEGDWRQHLVRNIASAEVAEMGEPDVLSRRLQTIANRLEKALNARPDQMP